MKIIWVAIPLVLFGVFGTEQSLAEEKLDFKNCEGFLTIEEIKNVVENLDDVKANSGELILTERESDLQTMCASTFESSGKAVRMTVVVMDSANAAITLYEKNLDSMQAQDYEIREYLTFWNNFDVVLNDQGLGSFMGSQYDRFFVSFFTSFDEDNKSLMDVEQLRTLSTIVQKKILDLDDVVISPPNPIPNLDDPDRFTKEHGLPPIEPRKLLSPKKQMAQGIEPAEVRCNEGFVLITKIGGESSACVKPNTVEILQKRGWGGIDPPCCKK